MIESPDLSADISAGQNLIYMYTTQFLQESGDLFFLRVPFTFFEASNKIFTPRQPNSGFVRPCISMEYCIQILI